MSKQPIISSDEAWEERALGADENYVKAVDAELAKGIDEAAGTQMISIRLQKSLIEDFKMIAAYNNGIGYQTLMKQILQRFVDSEKEQIWNALVSEQIRQKNQLSKKNKIQVNQEEKPTRQRKVA
jgi:uncharacterized protein (DUF4415 family)